MSTNAFPLLMPLEINANQCGRKTPFACCHDLNKKGISLNENKIAVLGAGTMGAGIAVTYAAGGYEVFLYSRTWKTLDRAQKVIAESMKLLREEGILTDEATEAAEKRIHCTVFLEEAVQDAWYVTETIVEREDAKRALYQQLDGLLSDHVIIASDTSAMNIFEFMPKRRLSHTVIAHFYAPAYILPLVEVVGCPETLPSVVDTTLALHRKCGKSPIFMERFVPGFIVNRLQEALNREVIFLLENGYCTPEELDVAVKTSLMPRGLLLGLVQRMDFTGLDMVCNVLRNQSIEPAPACTGVPPMLEERCQNGDLGVKTGKGFFDYASQSYEEVLRHRDRQLLKSVRLAADFMADPLNDENA